MCRCNMSSERISVLLVSVETLLVPSVHSWNIMELQCEGCVPHREGHGVPAMEQVLRPFRNKKCNYCSVERVLKVQVLHSKYYYNYSCQMNVVD